LEPTVSGIALGQSSEKLLRRVSQCQKGLSNWLQTVTHPLVLEVIRVLYSFPQSRRRSFMAGKEINLRRVDQNFVLCGLKTQNVSDVLGRDGVIVRFKLNESVRIADPKGHFGAVVGMKRKGLKPLLSKEF